MPRLRKLKNFNFDFDFVDSIEQEEIKQNSDFARSGEHWLSNDRIINSLANDELLQAIKYHEFQISSLREVLDLRSKGLRSREEFPSCEFYHPLQERRPKKHKSKSTKRSSKQKKLAAIVNTLLQLNPNEVAALLQERLEKLIV